MRFAAASFGNLAHAKRLDMQGERIGGIGESWRAGDW
jgi:hypothetical protein